MKACCTRIDGKVATPSPSRRQMKLSIRVRPLLDFQRAQHLEMLFKTLANVTRLRLLHALIRSPESGVTQIAETLSLKMTTVSNQLQKLASQGILASVREGQTIRYRIVDPCVPELLATGWRLAEDTESPLQDRPFTGRYAYAFRTRIIKSLSTQ